MKARVDEARRIREKARRQNRHKGCRMGRVMASRGMTEMDMERASGIGQSYINRVKNGQILPTIPLALALAKALGVTVADLWPPAEFIKRKHRQALGMHVAVAKPMAIDPRWREIGQARAQAEELGK